MTPAILLADLQTRGVRLYLAGDELRYKAKPGVLTPDLAAAVKPHKSALITLLRQEEAAIAWRVEAMQQQIPTGGPVPFLGAVPNVAPVAGVCLSCGDPIELVGYVQRCRLCVAAADRALAQAREDIAQAAEPVAA